MTSFQSGNCTGSSESWAKYSQARRAIPSALAWEAAARLGAGDGARAWPTYW